MNTLFGLSVRTSPLVQPVPVLKISHSFTDCSDKFRTEFDSWLLNLFGVEHVAYVVNDAELILNPLMLAKIKASVLKNSPYGSFGNGY